MHRKQETLHDSECARGGPPSQFCLSLTSLLKTNHNLKLSFYIKHCYLNVVFVYLKIIKFSMVRGFYVVFTTNFLFLYFIHRYTGGGTTTDAALRYARQNMFVRKHGMRKGVAAEIAIVITDGKYHTSRVVRKPAFCICENKDADQLRGNREADQRLCFRYTYNIYNSSSS